MIDEPYAIVAASQEGLARMLRTKFEGCATGPNCAAFVETTLA